MLSLLSCRSHLMNLSQNQTTSRTTKTMRKTHQNYFEQSLSGQNLAVQTLPQVLQAGQGLLVVQQQLAVQVLLERPAVQGLRVRPAVQVLLERLAVQVLLERPAVQGLRVRPAVQVLL
eukprot:PhM_4_TR5034/c0_g1_i5/m.48921